MIEPGGYLGDWCRANGAEKSLRLLYRSAFTAEAVCGNKAQQVSGAAQLVTNKKRGKATKTVGMSMVPSIWIVNFALIYTLNPSLAAKMPTKWARFRPALRRRSRQAPRARFRTRSTHHRFADARRELGSLPP